MYYIAKIDEVGLLMPPFNEAVVDDSRRQWLGRDLLDRFTGLVLLLICLLEI